MDKPTVLQSASESTLPAGRRRHRLRTGLIWGTIACLLLRLGYVAIHHEEGRTVPPSADAPAGRWVILDGANNTRDLGGYVTPDGRRVRWRTVYRSGRLSGLSDAGGETFCELGIRCVIDFRYRTLSSPLFNGDAFSVFRCASVHLLPVHAVSSESGPPYICNVRENSESYREAFDLLADERNLPALFHCREGKDRTGVMAALLLTLLGLDRETVLDEFQLSDHVARPVSREAMSDLLTEVDRSGGIVRYLESIGVSAQTQERIRAFLLEPPRAG